MVITSTRVILAVVAFGIFFFAQSKQRKASDMYMKRVQDRQRRDLESQWPDAPLPGADSGAVDVPHEVTHDREAGMTVRGHEGSTGPTVPEQGIPEASHHAPGDTSPPHHPG